VSYVLRIEHPVPSYEGWKRAFDEDPIGRERGGVTRYRVLRDAGDQSRVQIDLEFATREEADAFLVRLHELWARVDVMHDPTASILEVAETHTYRPGREDD
jgi:hypothetical protein